MRMDVHIAQSGVLRAFDVVLFNHTGVTQDATISIYAGDPVDGPPGALLAAPYTIAVPYSVSVTNFHYEVPDYPMVERDLWFSVKFDVGGLLAGRDAHRSVRGREPSSLSLPHPRWRDPRRAALRFGTDRCLPFRRAAGAGGGAHLGQLEVRVSMIG